MKAHAVTFALLISPLVILGPAVGASAQGQTQWEFVPGSRQARPVTARPAQTAPAGTYYRPATSGGMQLRRAPVYPQGGYIQPTYQRPGYPQPSGVQQSTAQQSGSRQTTASSQAATPAAARGKSYDYADTVSVDGVNRSYRVHIPACYDRSRATPVVLAFHGLGMNAVAMLGMSGFNGLSERKNFIVVYGEGLNNRWNEGTGGVDDIGYVSEVLKKLGRAVNIDQRRIYACGISNGGFFAQRVGCALADKIAAVGVVSSSMMASSASMGSSNRMPIVFFLGTEDPLLPWGDGRNKALGKLGETLGLSGLGSIDSPLARVGGLMSVPEMINFWTGVNGCGGSPSVTQLPNTNAKDGTTVKKETYGSGDVTLYVIEGGGHTWPGMLEVSAFTDICGTTSQDIDASELMWEFFQRHSR
ncbi:MAG: hypothetical protein JSS83_08495 [Cyanobacteria bacterium SZAS LIN-3]|nr:hypothetical protein [Cyanobacteria bacterium SZAS LIN-3]